MRVMQSIGGAPLLLLGALVLTRASVADTSVDALSKRCDALASLDFSRIPDALTQVTEAKSVAASGKAPDSCEVSGYVAPSVGFVLRLPIRNWNGKFIELGCGGMCGTTDYIVMCSDPLRRGYACMVSDGGHRGGDAKWAYNNLEAKIDLAYRASHVTALAGKAIVESYYDRIPKNSYFMGCSRGGLQALEEAQKFPWDFDGIIAGAPGPKFTEQSMDRLWKRRAITDRSGAPVLEASDIELVHQAVVAQCDLADGVKDGLIADPRGCHFDPSSLLCTASRRDLCLSAKKVETVKTIYSGPVASSGEQITLSAALPGSERNWLDGFWGSGASNNYLGDGFRYTLFWPDLGPSWQLADFNFDRDYKRLGIMASLWEPGEDLRPFKTAGGKLLAYMGWSDVAAGGPLRTVDYYESAERIVGSRSATQDFFRLFMIPGMNHCTGGEGAFAIDYLKYLEDWVERGIAPDKMIGVHVALPDDPTKAYQKLSELRFPLNPAEVVFSRPVYPYPTIAKYRGRGDPRDAASFAPEQP